MFLKLQLSSKFIFFTHLLSFLQSSKFVKYFFCLENNKEFSKLVFVIIEKDENIKYKENIFIKPVKQLPNLDFAYVCPNSIEGKKNPTINEYKSSKQLHKLS